MLVDEILENPWSEGAKPKPERRRENADLPFATNVHTTNKPDEKKKRNDESAVTTLLDFGRRGGSCRR